MAEKNIFLHFRISPRQRDMLDELVEVSGAISDAELVRRAIMELHSRLVGSGATYSEEAGKLRGRGRPKKEEGDKQRERNLIKALEGELVDQNGAKVVKYKIYEVVNPNLVEEYEQEIPLSHLSKELVDRQYKPNRAEVERVQAKMKKS